MPITFDHEQAVERILHVYDLADEAHHNEGASWYWDMRDFLLDMADHYNTTLRVAAGVTAALSPGIPYERNVLLAQDMLHKGDCRHPYGDPIRKARRIKDGEPPLDVLRGDKVRSFYDNIIDPIGSPSVTIDRHAYAITVAEADDIGPRGGARVRYQDLARKGMYERVAQAYRDAAEAAWIRPSQMQAITWCAWRGAAR